MWSRRGAPSGSLSRRASGPSRARSCPFAFYFSKITLTRFKLQPLKSAPATSLQDGLSMASPTHRDVDGFKVRLQISFTDRPAYRCEMTLQIIVFFSQPNRP